MAHSSAFAGSIHCKQWLNLSAILIYTEKLIQQVKYLIGQIWLYLQYGNVFNSYNHLGIQFYVQKMKVSHNHVFLSKKTLQH